MPGLLYKIPGIQSIPEWYSGKFKNKVPARVSPRNFQLWLSKLLMDMGLKIIFFLDESKKMGYFL
jgi:hypothetical protein